MPIEIKELIIRANVAPPQGEKRPAAVSSEQDRAQLVAECVEQVMEILRKNRER